ncbi:MAG: fasciclin domain-containing protein [Mucilaginibacter sp.]|uniref:fasciclin domain-containing protein n=1 Tax=Mucilaginibacter sp. TaxID=1882438 RepID=UPI003266D292
MKSIIKKSTLTYVLAVCILAISYLSSCKKTVYPLLVNPGLNITGYFEANPQFSLFDQILEKTGYAGFLGAYGAYTVFAPNNDAVNAYLKGMGKTTVDQVNIDTLKDMVKFHIIQDTITTGGFKDGKLATPTIYGQYITTGAVNISGVSSYIVNQQALVLQSNILLGNGIVHAIDHVLKPAKFTIAQLVEKNPKYSIFYQALKATTFYDTLNVAPANATNKARPYLTMLAVSDSVFNTIGITSYATLKTKYSNTGNPANPADSLYKYVAYHILPEFSFLSDIISTPSHNTLAPQEVITDALIGTTILINNDTFNGVLEPGVPVDRANSNIPATNGVLHSTKQNYKIKVRSPTRVDWDLADQPEFRSQTTIFRRAGKSTVAYNGPLAFTNITINGGNISYFCESSTTSRFYWWDDELVITNFRPTTGQMTQVIFKTPTIIKGKYKVWFMWRTSTSKPGAQFFFDGGNGVQQPLQNIITAFTNNMPSGSSTDTGPVLESKGYKRYSAAPNTDNVMISILLGVVDVQTTDKHLLYMNAIGTAAAGSITADMIQFIPVDQDQLNPRFNRDGTLFTKP